MKKIALLGCGNNSLSLIKFLKKRNFFIIGIDKNKKAPGLKKVDYALNICCSKWKKIYKELDNKKIFYIACGNGDPVISAAILNKKNKNLYLNISTAKNLKKKTNYIKIYNHDIIINKNKLSTKELPIIVKKNNLSGGTGVLLIKSKIELKKLKSQKIIKKYTYFEKFLDATNYIITGYVLNKKLYMPTLFEVNLNKKFKINGIKIKNFNLIKYLEILNYILKIINHLKINFGPVNFQIFSSKKKLYLAEVEAIFMGSGLIERANKLKNNNCYEFMLDSIKY